VIVALIVAGILIVGLILIVLGLCRAAADGDAAMRATILRDRARAHQREDGHA
jgi:hypothetical protein